MDQNLQRFIEYVQIDTQSDDTSDSVPSTAKQLNLSRLLLKQLQDLGMKCHLNEYGIVYGYMEGEASLDPIGLNSHVDTALECSGANVKPQIIKNYDGGVISLGHGYSMSPEEFPSLSKQIGSDLVVTSGDTLLGADDKAGIAIIMAVLHYYHDHPEIKHHPICVCFTPDEEIGRGPDHFDAKEFGAKYAFTVDGGDPNEIACETFNAAHAQILIHGKSIHPGEAKGKLVNAMSVAFAFDAALPPLMRPEFTSDREGFNHLVGIEGNVDLVKMAYIIRNHDKDKLEEQKQTFLDVAKNIEGQYPGAKIEVNLGDDYRNMAEIILSHPEVLEKARSAFAKLGITPVSNPVRGGTDGATFSFKGCPTPNLGTGSYNHHGRFEYLSVREFDLMIEIVKEILKA